MLVYFVATPTADSLQNKVVYRRDTNALLARALLYCETPDQK
jgi:hypothetical protein